MFITELYTLADFAAAIAERCVPSIFSRVTYNDETKNITFYTGEDQIVMEIQSRVGDVKGYIYAYSNGKGLPDDAGRYGSETGTIPSAGVPIKVAFTSNGFFAIIRHPNTGGAAYKTHIICTLSNNGVPAIVFGVASSTSSDVSTSGVRHIAVGDSFDSVTKTSFTKEDGNQIQMTNFPTDARGGTTSYMPNAFYMPMYNGARTTSSSGTSEQFIQFIFNGELYVSNTFWALRDGGEAVQQSDSTGSDTSST